MAENSASSSLSAIIESYSSLYYLHSSDNPAALITSVLFCGDDYTKWATELSNSIQTKQKLGFIKGTIPEPTAEPDLSRWMATNLILVRWIRISIDPK